MYPKFPKWGKIAALLLAVTYLYKRNTRHVVMRLIVSVEVVVMAVVVVGLDFTIPAK